MWSKFAWNNAPTNEIKYVEVGFLYFRYLQLKDNGDESDANKILEQINLIAPNFLDTKK